ncbi:MAG: ROK family protein [Actinobacteria bacterium]|nr:ROK family protein [Actinomycetota bacterium]MBU1942976.1 ROK family protein [Actinomycetota bacterium]MBU2687308.1 ROK family protein [Actinomycetota bacterium]
MPASKGREPGEASAGGAAAGRTRDQVVIGVDVGGTNIRAARVGSDGRVFQRFESPSPARDQEMMVDALVAVVAEAVAAGGGRGEVRAVGLGAAGYVLHETGVVMEAPNIAWRDVPLRSVVSERAGLAVFLDNDANAAAAGEHLFGVARGVDDFVYLTLGTGIGGGIFIDGKVYRGRRGTAAELGHVTVDPTGPVCGCGRRGCLEALASGTALEREAERLVALDPGSVLHGMSGGDSPGLEGEAVARAAEEGDRAALAAFEYVSLWLGIGIVNFIHVFDPELVVLGGGMARSGHLLLDSVRRSVAEHGIGSLVRDARIELSCLGGDAGVVGAAAMAWEGIG